MDQTTIPSGLLSQILLAQAPCQKQVVAGHRGRSIKKPSRQVLRLVPRLHLSRQRVVAGDRGRSVKICALCSSDLF